MTEPHTSPPSVASPRRASCLLAAFLALAAVVAGCAGRSTNCYLRWLPKSELRKHGGVVHDGFPGPGAGTRVVLVAGDEEYRSEETLPQLAKMLAMRHGFECIVLWSTDAESGDIDPDARGHIPGLEALDGADMLVLFTRFRRLPDADMAHIVDYVESGRPILGIRTATHAFAYEGDSDSPYAHWSWNAPAGSPWPGGFGRQILGETWVNHHGKHGGESTRGVVAAGAADHPVVRGVSDVWGPTDVYGVRDLPPDATVLLEGLVLAGMSPDDPPVADERNDPPMPLVWARERAVHAGRTQRIVTSTIGASVDFASEDLRRLFVNAVYWCTGLEDELSMRADAQLVGEFEPTPFGFGGFVPGVRPEDHLLEIPSPGQPPAGASESR